MGSLIRIRGIGKTVAQRLANAGIETVEDVAKATKTQIAWIKGIGMISAKKIIENAHELINLEKGIQQVLNSIKINFSKSCPKCGGDMNEKFIILGPERRIRAKQCKLCRFYMPV